MPDLVVTVSVRVPDRESAAVTVGRLADGLRAAVLGLPHRGTLTVNVLELDPDDDEPTGDD